jgi:ribonuclease HI
MNDIIVFTDGSSRGNPGPGGYGVLIVRKDIGKVVERGGRESRTTNNKMELTAAYEALHYLKGESKNIEIHTDSAYLINGITKWIYGWEKNGWKTSTGGDVENKEIWMSLVNAVRQIKGKIIWKKVKGHAGVAGNERVDEIATLYADSKRVILFNGALDMYEKLASKDILSCAPEKSPSKKKVSSKKGVPYSYVSMVDGIAKTHNVWADCEKRVKGKKGALYKKVFSKSEETDLIQEWTLKDLLG